MDKKILIIDDDEITLNLLKKVLRKAGYQTTTANTGYEGLKSIRTDPPQLLVLDLTLPDIDGVAVFEDIRKDPNLEKTNVIVLSSRDDPDEIASLLTKGVNDYIVKKRGAEKELLGKCASYFARLEKERYNRGRVISFFSAKGGNGTSTLCLNLAHALTEVDTAKEILVADLVLPLGSISLMVGLEECSTIAELSAQEMSATIQTLDTSLPFLDNWGFSILAGSRTPREAQDVNPDGMGPLFLSLRERFDYVLVDLGRTLSRISIPIVQQSGVIVVVLGPDLVTVDLTKSALDYLAELEIVKERIFPVLNRAVGLEGLTKAEIEQKIGVTIRGTISHTGNNFTLATNQNLPYKLRYETDGTSFELNSLARKLKTQLEEAIRAR